MTKSIFEFEDYKTYLLSRLDSETGLGKGGRSQLCSIMGCKRAYLSQVLNGAANLSLEQGDAINNFLRHNDQESEMFLLMIQLSRSGTSSLQRYLKGKIFNLRNERNNLAKRFQVADKIELSDMVRYYSSWRYAAVHVLTTIPKFRDRNSISERLGLTSAEVGEILEFLIGCGLISRKGSLHEPTKLRLHIGEETGLASKSHLNWKMQAMRSIERSREANVHYSSVVSLSKKDIEKIRESLVKEIEKVKSVIKDSPPEELYCFSLDWFLV